MPLWCCAAASATPGTETTRASTVHLSPETRSVTFSEMSVTVGEYPLPRASTGRAGVRRGTRPGTRGASCQDGTITFTGPISSTHPGPPGELPLPPWSGVRWPSDPTVPCLLPAVVPAAAVKEGEGDKHPYIVACLVKTPKMEITISQTWGWARAQANPDLEGWTAPYTWLDADVVLLKALAAPVTGILGECGTPACLPACLTGPHMPAAKLPPAASAHGPTPGDTGDLYSCPCLLLTCCRFFLLSAGNTYPKGQVQEDDLDGMAAEILGDSAAHGRNLMARSSLFPMLADLRC